MNAFRKIATLSSVLVIACFAFFACGQGDNDSESGRNSGISGATEITEITETTDKSDTNTEISEETGSDTESDKIGNSSEEVVSVIKDGGKYEFNK